MPSEKIVYECKYCCLEFADYDECKEHEQTHIRAYDKVSNAEIAKELRMIGESATAYHIHNIIMGRPLPNFKNLMKEAAHRLEN